MRRLVQLHRWLGLLSGLLVLVPAVTAIAMNHRGAFSPSDAPPSGPFDQYVICLAVHPRDANRLYLGTSDGLWRSDDGGRSFAEMNLPVRARQLNSIAFDRQDRMYVSLHQGGVLMSEDDGRTFKSAATVAERQISAMTVAPDGSLLVATPEGIRRLDGPSSTLFPRPPSRKATRSAWLRLAYDLHDGQFWGEWGVCITDAAAGATVVLVLSGFLMFWRGRRSVRPT